MIEARPALDDAGRDRRRRRLFAAAAGLAVASVLQADLAAAHAGSRVDGASARDIGALVLGRAGSPVLRALRSVSKLDTVRRAITDRRQPRRYDMLIVDGDEISPRALRHREPIRDFLGAGRWVAAFDASAADQEALSHLTGFDPARHVRRDRSELLLFRVSMVERTPTVDIVDSGRLGGRGIARVGERRRRSLKRRYARRVARLVESQVDARRGRAAASADDRLCASAGAAASYPDLQRISWCYTELGQSPTPDGHWTQARRPWWMNRYGPAGEQTARWTMNHRFDVYLSNDSDHPSGNFQIITYSLNGQFTPKEPQQRFFRMDDRFTSGWMGPGGFTLERAWWTGQAEVSVRPDYATDRRLAWQASHPASPNSETQYSSGEQFDVGFLGAKPDAGFGFNATASFSNSRTHSIPDWGVQNQTSGNALHWTFSSRNPCDSRTQKGCFGRDGSPAVPNELSRGQLQLNASARWETRGRLQGDGGPLTFAVETPVNLVDTYCRAIFGMWCPVTVYRAITRGPATDQFQINAAWVNPIPITALRLRPNPANGGKSEKVSGTVELERAARVPVTVRIFSNSENASVGGPLPGVSGGSQHTITIRKGESRGTFTVHTNANNLRRGEHTTAAITAFYTEATTARLRVEGG